MLTHSHRLLATFLNFEKLKAAAYRRHLLLHYRSIVIIWPAILYLYCSVPGCSYGDCGISCLSGNRITHWSRRSSLGANMSKPEDSMDTGDTGENSVRFVPFSSIKCCWAIHRLERSDVWLLRSLYFMIWASLRCNYIEIRFSSGTMF